MFHLSKKKSEDSFEKQLKQTVTLKKVPILTLDSRWHMLFPEEKKTMTIRRLEEQVNELLKKQGKLVQDAKRLKKMKRNFMQKIVNNMQESETKTNETTRIKKLESSQRYIKEINDKLNAYDDQLEVIPQQIRVANEALLKASFQICYDELKKNKKQIRELNQWINKTKALLMDSILKEQELQQNNSDIYSYMHDILGAEMMEVFDQEYL